MAIFVLAPASFRAVASRRPPDLRFEVASLKPVPVDSQTYGMIRPAAGGERCVAVACPVRVMLQVAFRVRAEQITGIPGWHRLSQELNLGGSEILRDWVSWCAEELERIERRKDFVGVCVISRGSRYPSGTSLHL
jgi:hypothetical protein